MKTQFQTPEKYAEAVLKITDEMETAGSVYPVHFQEIMYKNRGFIGELSPFERMADGLERRNPLIVALGDSVTAGHFEFHGSKTEFFERIKTEPIRQDEIIECIDVKECYLEKFRNKLIERYEQTSVNALNAGIAGDTIYGMRKRVYRDVIMHQPDLVLINGSLNWGEECGTIYDYENALKETVFAVSENTNADIVLMTPNKEIPEEKSQAGKLKERVEVIRNLAEAGKFCLADTYEVWERYEKAGYPLEALLANGANHPSVTGHEVYARVLMKLMRSS